MPVKVVVTADPKNVEAAFDEAVKKLKDVAIKFLENPVIKANLIDYALQLHSYRSEWNGSPGAYLISQIEKSATPISELHLTIGSEVVQPLLEKELASLNIVPKDNDEKDVFTEVVIEFADQITTDFREVLLDDEGRDNALKVFSESVDRNLLAVYAELQECQKA